MTARIRRFIAEKAPATPCLIMDLDIVEQKYEELRRALPFATIYYAMKANPAAEILQLLARLGSSFDAASIYEIRDVIANGATPDRVSFGNTIKKKADIAAAYELGVRLFAFDSEGELDKLAAAAPGARVFCRIVMTGGGSDWPLGRQFGCEATMTRDQMLRARDRGVDTEGKAKR